MSDHIHEGIEEAITNLKEADVEQKGDIKGMKDKVDNIMTRLNVILGGLVVSAILHAANLAFKSV